MDGLQRAGSQAAAYLWNSVSNSVPTANDLKGLLKESVTMLPFAVVGLAGRELVRNLIPAGTNSLYTVGGAFILYCAVREAHHKYLVPYLVARAQIEGPDNGSTERLTAIYGEAYFAAMARTEGLGDDAIGHLMTTYEETLDMLVVHDILKTLPDPEPPGG